MNDTEVHYKLLNREITPDQLDAWYLGIPERPSAYQMALYSEGRALLLSQLLPLARNVVIMSPPERVKKLRVRASAVPDMLAPYMQASDTGRHLLTWLVPADKYDEFVVQLRERGYEVVEQPPATRTCPVYVLGDTCPPEMSGRIEREAPKPWRCWDVAAKELEGVVRQLRGLGHHVEVAVLPKNYVVNDAEHTSARNEEDQEIFLGRKVGMDPDGNKTK